MLMHLAKADPCPLMFARTLHVAVPRIVLESGYRYSPAVEAKDEFVKIDRRILLIDSLMSTIEPRF
jgi:hypothetical protein